MAAATGPQISDAARALDAGRAAEVRPYLEQSVNAKPADVFAWALLARTYLALKEPAKAKAAAERAERGIAGSPDAQHALALYYAQSGNRKRAAELEGMYASSPKADSLASVRAALLHFETGGYAEAIRFGRMTPDRTDIVLMLARAYEARKETDASLAAYEKFATLKPWDEESYSQLGQAYLRAGRFTEALNCLEGAVRKFDKSPQLELALGVAYYGQRRFLDAGRKFLRVIDLNPEIEQPYVFLAKMVDQLESLRPEIVAKFTAWNASEKKNHFAPFVLAKVTDGNPEPLLREAIRRQPAFWESHFDLGVALEQKRNFAAAAAEFEESARLSPNEAAPQYRLARIYARLGQPEKAAAARAKHEKLTAANAKPGMH